MTENQYNTLLAIRDYTYITAQQLADIGIFKSAKEAQNKALLTLKKKGLICFASAGITGTKSGGGKEKSIYFVSEANEPVLPNKLIQLLTDAHIYLKSSKKAESTQFHHDLLGEYLTCQKGLNKYHISTYELEARQKKREDKTIVLTDGTLKKLKKKL